MACRWASGIVARNGKGSTIHCNSIGGLWLSRSWLVPSGMGARLTRAVALSDPAVVDELNDHFVSLEINLSDQSFPAELSGLSIWKEAYERDSRYSLGFSTSVVLGPDGTTPFGTSGCGHQGELETAINYHADKFLVYLQDSRDRYIRSKEALQRNELETVKQVESHSQAQLRQANICKCEVKKEIFPSDAR